MLEATVFALGRTVREYFRSVQPIASLCSSLIHRFHNCCHSKQRQVKSVCKRWKTDVAPDNEGAGLPGCRLDSSLLQNFTVTSYAAVYLRARQAQIGRTHPNPVQPINICYHFPLCNQIIDRSIHILRSEPNPLKIDASPTKEEKDNSIRVIREVNPGYPALDTDFLHYLEGQKALRIQKEAAKLRDIDTKPDVDGKKEITAKCGKNDRKDDQKSGKEFKQEDKKKKSKKEERADELRAEFAEVQKKIKSEMNMAKEWAEKKYKSMEEAENGKKDGASKARRSDQKVQFLVAELKAMQEACRELTEKIERVKEEKRQEMIKSLQGVVAKYQRQQSVKDNQQEA